MTRDAVRWLGLLLLVIGGAEYGLRGPVRALRDSGDLAAPYAATRLFWKGGNSYDQQALQAELESIRVSGEAPLRPTRSLYPPQTFLLLSPFLLLTWEQARGAMALVDSLLPLVAAALLVLARRRGKGRTEAMAPVLLLVLLWAPLHTGIAKGQPAVPCISMALLSLSFVSTGRSWAAGLSLTAATFLKPHLALPILAYFVLRRRWQPVLVAGSANVAASILAIAWWGERTPEIVTSALRNLRYVLELGAAQATGPFAWHRIDLAPLWPAGALPLSLVLAGAMLLLLLLRFPPPSDPEDRSEGWRLQDLWLTALCLTALLTSYHRFYDAALLILPLASVLSRPGQRIRLRPPDPLLPLLVLPFLLPYSAILTVLGQTHPGLWIFLSGTLPGHLLLHNCSLFLLLSLGICAMKFVSFPTS